jgi:5-formyltetrahydrofolate cyclo-ligase
MNPEKGKQEIRRRMLERRRAMTSDERASASLALCRRIEQLPAWERVRVLAAFWPLGNEPDIVPLLRRWLSLDGHVLALPRIEGPEPSAMRFYQFQNPEADLQPGALKLLEPDPSRCEPLGFDAIEWVWVPGVAFDATGNRLGRGRAYYDAFLARLHPAVETLGIAYEWQITPAPLPVEPWDRRLTHVATELRLLCP